VKKRRTKLTCGCGTTADLKDSPKAWNGWQVAPNPVCPDCIARSPQMQEPGPPKRIQSIGLTT